MVDVVGLRFITEGEKEAIAALREYQTGVKNLSQLQDKHVAAMNRAFNEELRGLQNLMRMRDKAAAEQANILRQTEREQAEALAQGLRDFLYIQGLKTKAAQEEAEAQRIIAERSAQWTGELNARMGVTGQRATELGASFSRLAEVQDNLQAAAAAWTGELNARMGVTGQRATELGATFDRLAEVQRNLAAGAAAWTAQLNERLGITGTYTEASESAQIFIAAQTNAQAALDRLRASIDPTVAASQRLAAAQRTVDEAVRNGVIALDEGEQVMRQYQDALNDTSKANELLRAKTEMMARAYNPVMAATMAYERQVESLTEAHRIGVLSADQLEAKLAELRAAYASVGGNVASAQRFVNQFGEVTRVAGVSTNHFGMVAQQVGYQVGDFFVQVQSGTNAFVAFGQQATQLAGLLPGLAGAVVGIGISVGTMFLAMWDRSRQAREGVDALKEAVESLQSAAKSAEVQLTQMSFGLASSQEAAALIELQSLTQQLTAAQEAYNEAAMQLAENEASLQAAGAAGRAFQELQAIQDRVRALREEIDAYQEKLALIREEEARLAAIQTFYDLREQEAELNAEREAGVQRILQSMQEEEQALLNRLTLASLENEYGRNSVQYRQAQRALEEEVYRQQLAQNGILGKNQDRLVEMRREVDAIANAAQQVDFNPAAQSAANMVAQLREALGAVNALLGAIDSLGFSNIGSAARVAALERGADVGEARVAGMIAEQQARLAPLLRSGDPEARAGARATLAEYEARLQRELELSQREAEILETRRELADEGGGGASAEELATLTSITNEMTLRVERERELIGLTGQARRERELMFEIQDQLRQQEVFATEEAIQNAAAKIAAEEAVNAKMLEQQQIVENLTQTIKTQMADAFMSIVDGTKSAEDAFKDMARIIIAELYDVLVVQQLVAAMSSAISGFSAAVVGVSSKPIGQTASLSAGAIRSAMGNVFTTNINRAPSVIPFAVGGVVNTPTMFPMAGGNVGLMGEAGPEAIMPLKRGRDGKLGVQAEGGGTVVVNNHFNVSANGDESVKRIVAQQIPTIARATEAAVIDARQRGGKMRSAFR